MAHDAAEIIHHLEWKLCSPEWELQPGETEDERIERLLEGFVYFCAHYVNIRHPERGKILFDLYDAQKDTVRVWLKDRNSLALKARQIGFSTVVSVFALWLTFFYQDRTIIMISKGQREASDLLVHAKYAYNMFPEWLRIMGPPQVSDTRELFSFANNSIVESHPSASNPARGRTAFTVVVDEIGFLPNSEEAWASIEPVSDVGGRVIMLGTANGEGNLFHREWVRGSGQWVDRDGTVHRIGTGDGRFTLIFHGWWANGRDAEWHEAKSLDLPTWQMAQEYPSNPDEAFLKSGNPVFDVEALSRYATEDPIRGDLHGDTFRHAAKGALRIWEFPKEGHRYCIGADVAEGLAHGDFSCAHVIDVTTNEVVAKWHGHVDPDIFGEKTLPEIGKFYGGCLIGVENNNHGHTTLKFLQRSKYPLIYRQRRLGTKAEQKTEILGWRTTAASKPRMIDELHRMTRSNDLVLPDSETISEMRQFVREPDGKMHAAPPNNDDRVMSLAVAVMMVSQVFLPEYNKKPAPGPGTWGFFMEQMYSDAETNIDNRFGFGYRAA